MLRSLGFGSIEYFTAFEQCTPIVLHYLEHNEVFLFPSMRHSHRWKQLFFLALWKTLPGPKVGFQRSQRGTTNVSLALSHGIGQSSWALIKGLVKL